MKKIVRVLSLAMLALIITLSTVGCSFVQSPDGTGETFPPNGGNNTEVTTPSTDENNNPAIITPLVTKPAKVTFNGKEDDGNRTELSLVDAVAKVNNSVVAIEMDGLGAGVIIDIEKEGDEGNYIYILTCHHVISSAGNITVYLPDNNGFYGNHENYDTRYKFTGVIGGKVADNSDKAVTLVGGDKQSDLAVIKINLDIQGENPLTLDDITKVKIAPDTYSARKGEAIFAIGNPTGQLPGWLADGIIASLEEVTSVSDIGEMKLMGINVATNPGNSGGGLFNLYGELIGITNAGNTEFDEINFAIPLYTSDKDDADAIDSGIINIVTNLVGRETAVNYGYVDGRKNKLGITITPADEQKTQVLIHEVVVNSAASVAGIKAGDIVIGCKVNDEATVTSFNYEGFIKILDGLKVGDTIKFTLKRGTLGGPATVEATINITLYHFCNTGEEVGE